MTEDEAKTKWCPMTRCGNAEGCNRSDANDRCIASDCMMWINIWSITDDHINDPAEIVGGYCGLARR